MTRAQLKAVQRLYSRLDNLITALVLTSVATAHHRKVRKAINEGIKALSVSDAMVWLTEADQKRTEKVRRTKTVRRTTRRRK